MTRTWLTVVILSVSLQGSVASSQTARRFDIIITEIFADPVPSVGLPQNEFIEIQNISSTPIDLKDWKLGDGNSLGSISIGFLLQPDSIAIICPISAVASFSSFGKTTGVTGFPSLDNDADIIFLRSKEGTTIHAINYYKSWYKNDLKSNGGWSLEMIDNKNPCGGSSNWRGSIATIGGTPGKRNSIEADNEDVVAPVLVRTYALDSVSLVAVFNESIDSLVASGITRYVLDGINSNPSKAIPVAPLFKEVILQFSQRLDGNNVYRLAVSNMQDCSGNMAGLQNVKAGLPSTWDQSDIIINELLFNPKADGSDYIELYNKSKKIIDLQDLYCANRNVTGVTSNIIRLSEIPYLIFPGEFVVFTENLSGLKQSFVVKDDNSIVELNSLPTLPDDKGSLVILNVQGITIDEIEYDSRWHFALLENKEGIALERIDYSMPTQNKDNWTSAASSAGYGTPGYQNSQFKADIRMQGSIGTDVAIFSPDNDGFNDLVTISYQMTSPGFAVNMTIFDVNGRQVRYLVKNSILGLQGSFRWDGLDDNSKRLPVGIYIVFTEIFNLQGKSRKFKNVVTLARKL